MELITSKDNKRIKIVRKLISSASFRREEKRFTAEGLRLCDDALKSGVSIEEAYFSEDFAEKQDQENQDGRHEGRRPRNFVSPDLISQ